MIVATAGAQKALLREEFPSLTFVELPGYQIKYDKNRALTIFRLMRSIPKILIRIKRENAWLRHFAALEEPDLVISDNRYGLTIPGIPCIFMTHQLLIKTPFGSWANQLLQRMNYRLIRRFSRCWIPDWQENGLAGELSHPTRMPPVTTRYIGWLSRFGGVVAARMEKSGEQLTGNAGEQQPATIRQMPGNSDDQTVETREYVLILLSGPEPQRTLLERSILRQASALTNIPQLVIVRGLPAGGPPLPQLPAGLTIHDHLPTQTLETLINQARLIITRPGYSTLMDLGTLGKQAVLIPTPGQTEQEYLGAFLAAKGWATCIKQKDFSLLAVLKMTPQTHTGPKIPQQDNPLQTEIKTVLSLR